MEKWHEVFKMFCSNKPSEYDAFFCIYEAKDSFLGYTITKDMPQKGVKIYLGNKKPTNIRYINCDHLYSFPKSVYYQKINTRYKLKELRDVVEILRVGKESHRIIDGKKCEIKDYDSITEEQRNNRKDPQLREELKTLIAKRERAIMQNDRKLERELSAKIGEINYKLGYKETQNPEKYQIQLKDTVTNVKPLRGGLCTPK